MYLGKSGFNVIARLLHGPSSPVLQTLEGGNLSAIAELLLQTSHETVHVLSFKVYQLQRIVLFYPPL